MTAKYLQVVGGTAGPRDCHFPLRASISGLSTVQRGPAARQRRMRQRQKRRESRRKSIRRRKPHTKPFLAAQGGDPAMQIQVGEDFITKFPMSRYVGGVYGMLTTAYYTTGNTDKMFAAGAKALELDPDNVDVLALLAMAIPRRVKSNTPDGPQQLQKAEVYAHHAIELIPNLTKPETVDDATFEKAKNDKLALCHSGLGLLDIDHQ